MRNERKARKRRKRKTEKKKHEKAVAGSDQPVVVDLGTVPSYSKQNRRGLLRRQVSAGQIQLVVQRERGVPIERVERKTRRNDPCPCESGRKNKHCCGRRGRSVG